MNKDLNILILFDHIHMVSNIADLLNSISNEVLLSKLIDIQQLIVFEDSESDQTFLITEWDTLNQFEDYELKTSNYKKIFIIDEKENHNFNLDNITFIKQSFFYTQLETEYIKAIKDSVTDINYIPIKWTQISNGVYPCDFYLKIKEEKFIKIVNQGSSIDDEIIVKYKDKGVTSLFIEHQYWGLFLEHIETKNKKNTNENSTYNNPLSLVQSTEAIHQYIKDIGIDQNILNKTKLLQKEIEQQFHQKLIKSLLNKLKSTCDSYLYNHSFLTSVLALEVSKKLPWVTEENKEKLYLASMFHDLGYKNSENAKYEELNLKEIKELPEPIRTDVLLHSTSFTEDLSKIKNIHPDIVRMIADHHGVHGSQSYPKQIYPTEVNLVFALFIICHEFSVELYKVNFEKSLINIAIESINIRFNKGNYKRVLSEFNEVISSIFLAK